MSKYKKIIIIVTLSLVISFLLISNLISKEMSKYSYSNDIKNFEIKSIGLEINKEYELDIDSIMNESSIEYSKYIIQENKEYYKVKKDKIIPIKEGVFNVGVSFVDKVNKTIYGRSLYKVYCYNPETMIKVNDVNSLLNMHNNKKGYYILDNNIDLKDINNFEPIGNSPYGNEFSGMFINPNNYVISNLKIETSKEVFHGPYGGCTGGLFGSVNQAYIDNIILDNVNIDVSDFDEKGSSVAGGLIAVGSNSLITNCRVEGNIKANRHSGGLIGSSTNVTIENCEFNGTVIQKGPIDDMMTYASGGLVGYLFIRAYEITTCYVRNNKVNATVISDNIAGGLAGYYIGDCHSNNTLNCILEAPNTYEIGYRREEF